MTLQHAVSKLVVAANRHGVFIPYPKDPTAMELDPLTHERLSAIVPDVGDRLNTPQVTALAHTLNKIADTRP